MNFNYSENIYLRKNCEIHDIYPLANNDLILLIYFNNSFYLDRIKLLVSRDLIKLEIKPIFAFICGPMSLGLIYRTEEKQKLLVFDSKKSILIKNKLSFKHDQEFFSLYFKETQITLLFCKSLDSISCYWLNKRQEIFNSFKLKENMDQIQKLIFFQLNNHNAFLYSVIKQQDTLIAVESNGQQKNIQTQQPYILNGCAQKNNIIILFYTPENEQSSIIELVNEKDEQIKVIDLNQNQFQFLVSIEYVLFQNDQYIWCRVSTDQMQNYQQIWVLDKEEFKLQHTTIYENEILQCICQKDLQIDQGIGLYERQKLLYLEENVEQEMNDEEAFDEYSEILVSFNLNPYYQLIKIMNQQNYDEHIIIDVCKKLQNTQIQF